MLITRISTAEGAGHNGANFLAQILHSDFTETTVATAQAKTVISAIVGGTDTDVVLKDAKLAVPFQDTTDADNNSTLVTVDDSTNLARFLASTEMNVNGTEKTHPTPTTSHVTAGATSVTVTATPPSGKNLAALNKGELLLWFYVSDNAA